MFLCVTLIQKPKRLKKKKLAFYLFRLFKIYFQLGKKKGKGISTLLFKKEEAFFLKKKRGG
jgi:hypothetical protein